MAADGFGVVVEIDQERFVEAGLDEAVRVTVVAGVEFVAHQEPPDVLDERLALEMSDRSGLRDRHAGRVTDREHVRLHLRLEGALVGEHEVERVAESRRRSDERRAAVDGNHHSEIKPHLAAIEPDQPLARPVDLTGVELRHDFDPSFDEHPAQRRRGGRCRERTIEWRHVRDRDPIADPAFVEVPIGEKTELERRHWALDREVDHVDDEAAAVERLQPFRQRRCTGEVVEGEHVLQPARAGQAVGLLRYQSRA